MNLVIDVGNSLLKIALFQKSRLVVKYNFSKSEKIDFDKIFKNLLIGPFKKYKNIHGSVVANKIYDCFDESYQPGIYIIENDKIKKV